MTLVSVKGHRCHCNRTRLLASAAKLLDHGGPSRSHDLASTAAEGSNWSLILVLLCAFAIICVGSMRPKMVLCLLVTVALGWCSATGPNWPSWFRQAHTIFGDHLEVEDHDEGPVLYLTTWFILCDQESTNEHSRIARLTADAKTWLPTLRQLWIDKIMPGHRLLATWVRPQPQPTPFDRSNNHLILFQKPVGGIVPALFSIRFVALHLQGITNAVAAVQQSARPLHIAELAKLDRVCRGRRCTVHHGLDGITWQDPIPVGENIRLVIPSPRERSHFAIDTHPASVAHVFSDGWTQIDSPLSMRIEDHSPFRQQLHVLWRQQSRQTPVSLEHTLESMTWYLDGQCVMFNDHCRPVVLGDDFNDWEADIRRAWTDLEDASLCSASSTPTSGGAGARSGFPANPTRSTWRSDQRLPFSTRCDMQCLALGRELTDVSDFRSEHGFGLNLIIHRPFLHTWEPDDDLNLM